jgi:hypothetical protein
MGQFGPIGSPRQNEKLAEFDANIALGRRLDEIAPAPEPWTEQRAARERLAIEFPGGDPSAQKPSEMLTAHLNGQFEALAKLPAREQAELAQQVANDFANSASAVSIAHSCYRRGADG